MAIYARLENGTYAEVTGVYKTDGTEITEIFQGERLVYSATNEIYGTVPLYYDGLGYELIDYLISGNAVQDGTPSPDAPVDATGCGVRTGNLLDESAASDADATHINYNKSVPILLTAGQTYTFSCDTACDGLYIRSTADDSNLAIANGLATLTYTPQVNVGAYCRIWNSNGIANLKPMLNLGSTPLPYEPYGFKLHPTVNGTEYPIYLGTVPTTRRIKKLVLTGEETSWYTSNGFMYSDTIQPDYLRSTATTLICSHYKAIGSVGEGAQVSNGQCALYRFAAVQRLYIRDNNYTSVADFKAYLAAQYAAGTPVTVWYVLAKPETAVVNEPLMKIGDYADTISFAQSQVAIPTVNGKNVLDMASPVKPSEVYIKGKGIKQNRGQS